MVCSHDETGPKEEEPSDDKAEDEHSPHFSISSCRIVAVSLTVVVGVEAPPAASSIINYDLILSFIHFDKSTGSGVELSVFCNEAGLQMLVKAGGVFQKSSSNFD